MSALFAIDSTGTIFIRMKHFYLFTILTLFSFDGQQFFSLFPPSHSLFFLEFPSFVFSDSLLEFTVKPMEYSEAFFEFESVQIFAEKFS